ncbi:MAG: hypothetical protein ACC645_10865 [Pirellulales bacterium]
MIENLFPLPLTPFERYMLADDRREYPMTFVMQFDFQGSVKRGCWEAAFHDALDRHPLLTSVVQGKRFWKPTSDRSLIVWLTVGDEIVPEGGEYMDLCQNAGVRVWMHEGDDQVRLTVQFHHACCDGIGALQFFGDWFAAYHARWGSEDVELVPLNPQALAQRGNARWKTDAAEPVSRWEGIKSLTFETLKFITRRLTPLRGDATHAENLFPGLLQHTFPVDVTRQLRQRAHQAGATLNDLMLRDLFATLAEWNGKVVHSKRWLQINMPTNLRGRGDRDLPAANVIGYALMARRAKDCADEEDLLQDICAETAAIRKWNLGQFFLDGLRRVQNIPGALSWFLSPLSCCATTVFSNLGDPTRHFYSNLSRVDGRLTTGELTLRTFQGNPPLRPLTKAVFLATVYAGELTIIMRADDRALGRDNSHKLLKQFVNRLLRSAALAGSTA